MPPELIIFDCDGVLIDSEGVASAVVARDLTALGWAMDAEEALEIFMGMSIVDMQPMIEARLGRALPADWRSNLADALLAALSTQSKLIPGVREMLAQVNEMGIRWRVASNSSQEEMAVKFGRTGIEHLTRGLTHAAGDVIARGGRPKPAPDVFLAAAESAGVTPERCVVLEDSALGVTGAVAAGMVCYGFAPHGGGENLLAAGARAVLRDWEAFFGVLE